MRKHLVQASVAALISMWLAAPTLSAPPFPEVHSPQLSTLRIISFPGSVNLPIWAGQRQGFFADERLNVRLEYTPGSTWQITHLLADEYDIGMTSIDNVVAYDEGQGEAYVPPTIAIDLVTVLGLSNGFLSVVAQKPIKTFQELKGKTVTVDALTTGFAFVLKEILSRNGVPDTQVTFARVGSSGDRFRDMVNNPQHAATIQTTPFDLLGEAGGFNTLVHVCDVIGPYQGLVATVRRSWAASNHDVLVRFVRAYRRSIDWLYDPRNREIAEALLVANTAGMTPALAAQTYDVFINERTGFFRTLEPNIEGIHTVLQLRTKYGEPHRELADPYKYIDLTYLRDAVRK